MSVAVATDPTFQYGTSGISNSDTIQSGQDIVVSDITWQTNNGLLNPKVTSTSTIIETINIVFDKTTSSGSPSISDSSLTITGGGKITSSNQPVIQLSSSQGIQIGSTGKGEIKVDFASAAYSGNSGNNARSAIIDLSQVASGVALKGNIFIGTGTADTIPLRNIQNKFIAKFGGNGMEGDITIKRTGDGDGLVSVFYLNGASADIDGKITLQAGMAIKNNIIYDNGNKNLKTSMDLIQGVLTYGFADTVNASDRIFTLDTSNIGEGTDLRSRIDISGGHLVFDDVKQVVFKNGSTDGGTFTISPKKIDSDTYEDGSVKFLFNSSAEANANNPIVKGNISATNGSVIFALKDTSGVTGANPFDSVTTNDTPPTKVYYIDGNLSTNNGGLSSFWDDTKGFYGKIATTSGHQISQTGGLIGRNDAWFSGSQNISSIQATTNGTSHLVFDQTTTIFGNTSKTETTAIRSTDGNSAMLLFRSGASISGDIRAKGDSSNIVVFEGDASIQNGAIKIENSGLGLQRKTNNVLMFNGLNNNIVLNSLSILGDWYTDNYSEKRQFNILSFNNPSTIMTATIGVANTTYGTNFIGKNIITENGYNSNLFDTTDVFYPALKTDNTAVEEFLKDDHQVKGTFTFGNGKGDAISGSNYINVENAIINGGISATSMTVIKIKNTVAVQGAVSQSESGTNNIYFDGKNSSINGGVIATGNRSGVGGNNISFKDGGTITGDISVSSDGVSTAWAGYNGNNIAFNGLSNASIIGNLSASDGQAGNKGNIINFNGSGINKIEGNITNSGAGRTSITFASSSSPATIKGNISITGGSSTITATQASLQITGNISQNGGQNTITLGGSNSSITGNIESRSNYQGNNENTITFSNGGSIIGDISVFGTSISTSWAGYNSNNITFNGADYNASIIGNLYAEEGSANKGNVITFNGNRTNKIEGNITTVNGGRTSITFAGTSSLLVTGDITTSGNGKNLFTLTANNSTLILQGENNNITTLTAIATADSENTLTLDATNNDSVFATIGTLANGGNLNVDFRGINGTKTTQLTLDTTNVTSLKSVSVASGLNNTLALTGTATMTIAEAVTIGETSGTAPKGVIFDLTSGADLTFAKGLTTNTKSVTTFKLGAENVITISSGNFTNNGIHNFDLNSTSGTTTFKYGASGLAFSSGENNINFNVEGIRLNWQQSDGTPVTNITTSGTATTNLNFINTGTINTSGLETTAGITNINIYNGKTATISGAIATSTGAQTNVLFKGVEGATTRADEYSTLVLGNASNQLTSVRSSAEKAKILLDGAKNATIDTTTIDRNASLVFAFTGENNSTVTTSGITVGEDATLGISLGGTGTQATKKIAGNVTFQDGSTLLVDFLAGNTASGVIGDNNSGKAFEITGNSKSIINFHGTNSGDLANGNIVVKDGGTNTVNFYGDASLTGVALQAGAINNINVYSGTDDKNTTDGQVNVSQVQNVTNTITLYDHATLSLDSAGNGVLTSSTLGNTLNFKGNGGILKGGFGATGSGSATINVGSVDKESVAGIITGEVSNATLAFNSGNSALAIQSANNTFKSINSQATNGVLVLDTATKNGVVNVNITEATNISAGKSLTFLFGGDNNSTVTTNGKLTVEGTLGVIINGDRGEKKITGNVDLGGRGTLLVEFAGDGGTVTLGDGTGISIRGGESSIINFRGNGGDLANAISLDGGTSTINFYRSGTVGGIALNSGTSIINVDGNATGYTVTLDGVGEVGNVTNIIKLGENATFDVIETKGGNSGSGSLVSSSSAKASELNFIGEGATFKGGFGAKDSGVATINVNATGASITGNVTKSSLAFGSNNGALTLKGATNTLTTISTADGASNTLTLDTTGGNNTTTVSGVLNASGLSVNLNTASSNNVATLSLNGGSLKSISVVNGDTSKNILSLKGGETSIANQITLASGKGLNIQFNGTSTLNLEGGYNKDQGTAKISVNTGNSILKGGEIIASELALNNTALSIQNNEASFATVSGNGTLVLDGANGATPSVKVTLTDVTGNLTAKFNGSETKGTELVINQGGETLKAIAFGTNSANNKLTLTAGATTITDKVEVGNNNTITFSLADGTTLNLAGGMTSAGNSTISVDSSGSANSAILSGGNINVSNVSLSGNDASILTLTATSTDIATLTTSATTSNTLIVDGAGSTNGASATLRTINGVLDVEMKGDASKVATLNLNGGTINSVSATSGDASENIINFESGTTTIDTISGNGLGMALNLKGGNLILSQEITADGSTVTRANHISVDVSIDRGSTLSLAGENNAIHSLSGNGVVDLAMADSNGNPLTRSVRARSGFKTLDITNYSGNNTFNLYVNTKEAGKADKVNLDKQETQTGNATFTVMGNIDDILGITYSETDPNKTNVLIASGTTGVNVEGGRSLIGYDIIKAQVIQTADGSVYLGEAISEGVAQEIKDVASSALTVNYDLFLANFNSLNKRMGELRDNPYSQGVWTRVFGGAMSNDFGAGSKTEYVTAQAGYDYSLTLGNANNYMGIAVAYGHSTTKSNTLNIQASQGATIALQDVKSNMVEVGIYNSYVMDSGWYNDTIFKFDYIMSSFTMTDNLSLESETNNFAMVLSDEFGYRYKFAESEKGNWYIDPQVEVAFGYFNQSDFNRAMVATNSTLEATQDNILTLRTRAGLSLGKKFNTTKGFASLYVGAFYEYDYINGGDAEVLSKSGIANPLDKLESNGRAIVNIGSNIELTEGVRMYIDVEKSFGDKQRTDMQFNFGARYSFGEKTPTISYQEQQKKKVAPLKVEDKQEVQESKTEASANTQEQKTQANTETKQ